VQYKNKNVLKLRDNFISNKAKETLFL